MSVPRNSSKACEAAARDRHARRVAIPVELADYGERRRRLPDRRSLIWLLTLVVIFLSLAIVARMTEAQAA